MAVPEQMVGVPSQLSQSEQEREASRQPSPPSEPEQEHADPKQPRRPEDELEPSRPEEEIESASEQVAEQQTMVIYTGDYLSHKQLQMLGDSLGNAVHLKTVTLWCDKNFVKQDPMWLTSLFAHFVKCSNLQLLELHDADLEKLNAEQLAAVSDGISQIRQLSSLNLIASNIVTLPSKPLELLMHGLKKLPLLRSIKLELRPLFLKDAYSSQRVRIGNLLAKLPRLTTLDIGQLFFDKINDQQWQYFLNDIIRPCAYLKNIIWEEANSMGAQVLSQKRELELKAVLKANKALPPTITRHFSAPNLTALTDEAVIPVVADKEPSNKLQRHSLSKKS